jgi:hypothetical protein
MVCIGGPTPKRLLPHLQVYDELRYPVQVIAVVYTLDDDGCRQQQQQQQQQQQSHQQNFFQPFSSVVAVHASPAGCRA